MAFSLVEKGFKKEEVRAFINKQRDIYENVLIEQKNRIASLRHKVVSLQQQVEQMKRDEDELCDAFMYALEQNNELKKAQENIYQLELQRLRDLYEKYRVLFEEKMSEHALLLSDRATEREFNILDEIGKDVGIEQAFSGFDFFEEQQTKKPKRLKGGKKISKQEKQLAREKAKAEKKAKKGA